MNWMKWLGPTYYEGVRENELNETKPCPVWVENVKAKEVSSYKANFLGKSAVMGVCGSHSKCYDGE